MNKLWCLFLGLSLAAADVNFDKAVEQASRGDCTAAVETLSALLKSSADAGSGPYRLLAFCQETLGRPAEAIRSARAGLAKHPAAPELELALGKLLLRRKPEDPEAGALLARAAGAMPGNPEARHYYAQWAYLNKRDRECVQQETAALLVPGLNDVALLQMNTLLGMCAGRIEAIPQAKAAFEKALAINGRQAVFDAESAYLYLQLLSRMGEDDAVSRVTNQILSRAPAFAPALIERAKQFDRAGEPQQAIGTARAALGGERGDINTQRAAHMILAKSYTILGKDAEARTEQAWIEQHPNPETPR